MPHLSHDSVFVIFTESQKKLKHCSDGPKFWYNLLNHCTSYIANNLFSLYEQQEAELRKINEKILGEIFDRALKLLKKNGYQQKHEMYRLVLSLKGFGEATQLCRHLHEHVLKKKINRTDATIQNKYTPTSPGNLSGSRTSTARKPRCSSSLTMSGGWQRKPAPTTAVNANLRFHC